MQEQQMHKVNMYVHASGDWHTCTMYMNAFASCPLTPVRDEVSLKLIIHIVHVHCILQSESVDSISRDGPDICHIPYFLDQTPPSNRRRTRIVTASYTCPIFTVAALELSPHSLIRAHLPRPKTVSTCLRAVLLYARKPSRD